MWTRLPAYLVGILLGWILHRTKDLTIFINRVVILKFKFEIVFRPLICKYSVKVSSSFHMGNGYCYRLGDYLRINSLPERRWGTSDKPIRPHLLRLIPPSRLVCGCWMAHLCLRSWIRWTRQSDFIMESLHPTESIDLCYLLGSCQLLVGVDSQLTPTDLLHKPGSRPVFPWCHLWSHFARIRHFVNGWNTDA